MKAVIKALAGTLLALSTLTAAARTESVTGSLVVQEVVYAPGDSVTPKAFIQGDLTAKQSLSVRVFCTSLGDVVLDQSAPVGTTFVMGEWDNRAGCEALLVLRTQKGQTVSESVIGHDSFTVTQPIELF